MGYFHALLINPITPSLFDHWDTNPFLSLSLSLSLSPSLHLTFHFFLSLIYTFTLLLLLYVIPLSAHLSHIPVVSFLIPSPGSVQFVLPFSYSFNLSYAPTLLHYPPPPTRASIPFASQGFFFPLNTCALPLFFFQFLTSSYRRCLALRLPVFAQLVLPLSPSPVSYLSQHRQSGCRSTDNPPACCELIHDKPFSLRS